MITTKYFPTQLAEEIFERKYIGDFDIPVEFYKALAKRVSLGNEVQEKLFLELFTGMRFSPGGRILAWNGRQTSKVSLMNCTTHEVEGDSLEDIAETIRVLMLASSHGQGIGMNISKLRPKESPVDNAAKTSTGAISFMELLNNVGGTIGQNGRRAALLFTMNDNHPDLWRDAVDVVCPNCGGKGCLKCRGKGGFAEDFFSIKKIPGRVENANISVLVSDSLMEAVQRDGMWRLEFNGSSGGNAFHVEREVRARDLFRKLAESAWMSAEPGVIFWDTSTRMSNSDLFGDRYKVVGNNACTEQVLDQDGVCNLGSLNLAQYVTNPFTKNAFFNFNELAWDTGRAVAFLDNVLEIELSEDRSITERQRESILALRRIGLGMMGLADAIAMMGLRYEANEDTIKFIEAVSRTMRDASYEKSIKLAQQFGPCDVFKELSKAQRKEIVEQGFYATLPLFYKKQIIEHGLRNAVLLSIAPTGSISNLYGVASGIEPIFARSYSRMVRMGGEQRVVEYVHPGVELSRAMGLPDSVWQTAYEVSPRDHVIIQAAVQKYVDAACSKTVNMPSNATIADVEDVYMLAWEEGLKGITVYRDASRSEQVLTSLDDGQTDEVNCPSCGSELIHQNGCTSCPSCGYGKCE